jgi:two-component system osmolarity sensor histidine kinase EnvZ
MTTSLHRLTLALIACCVAFILLVAAALMSWHTLDPGARQLARTLAATVLAQEPLMATSAEPPAAQAALGVRWDDPPQVGSLPGTPLALAIRQEIVALQPDWQVRIENGPTTRLWASPGNGRWVGVPFQPLSDPVRRASLWILAIAAVLVVAAAGWLARRLAAPLEQLVGQADALLDGTLDRNHFATAPCEVARLAHTLADAADQRRHRQREREEWLAGLSHDLRTPLARLRFAIELQAGTDPDERRAMAADIEEMDTLIGQFVGLVREGKNEAEGEFDLAELLQLVAASFARQAEIRVIGADDPHPFRGRAFALRRALGNLLQNALRHGAPPVVLEMREDADGMAIQVRNAARSDESGAGGFGIGLSVVRMVAALHGGRFDAAANDDGSMVATLRLPRPAPEGSTPRTRPEPHRPG